MNLQTFKAPTMAEALTQVKSAMGGAAVILHTRTFQTRYWLGLRRREMVEITAGKGFNVGERGRRQQAAARPVESRPAGGLAAYTRSASGNAVGSASAIARPVAPNRDLPPRNAIENSRAILETPAANSAVILGLTNEMAS